VGSMIERATNRLRACMDMMSSQLGLGHLGQRQQKADEGRLAAWQPQVVGLKLRLCPVRARFLGHHYLLARTAAASVLLSLEYVLPLCEISARNSRSRLGRSPRGTSRGYTLCNLQQCANTGFSKYLTNALNKCGRSANQAIIEVTNRRRGV
jgi:hypothetical protein